MSKLISMDALGRYRLSSRAIKKWDSYFDGFMAIKESIDVQSKEHCEIIRGVNSIWSSRTGFDRFHDCETLMKALSSAYDQIRTSQVELESFGFYVGDNNTMLTCGGLISDAMELTELLTRQFTDRECKVLLAELTILLFKAKGFMTQEQHYAIGDKLDSLGSLLVHLCRMEGNKDLMAVVIFFFEGLKATLSAVSKCGFDLHFFYDSIRSKRLYNFWDFKGNLLGANNCYIVVDKDLVNFFSLPNVRRQLVVRYGDRSALTICFHYSLVANFEE